MNCESLNIRRSWNSKVFIAFALFAFSTSSNPQAILNKIGASFPMIGSDLSAWNQLGNASWLVTPGEVAVSQGKGFLVSKLSVSDFQIDFQYWVGEHSKASFFFRAIDPNLINLNTAYEINLASIVHSESTNSSATFFSKEFHLAQTAGKWNRLQVTALGEELSFKLNDDSYQTVNTQFGRGFLAISFESGELRLRNINVTIPGRW